MILHTCLQPAVEGSAARVHSEAVCEGLTRRGLRVVRVWNTAPRGPRAWSRHWWRVLRAVPRAEVVYSRWHVVDLPTCLLARLHRKRLVLEVNGGLGDVPVSRVTAGVLRLLARAEFRLAHTVICVSPGLQEWVRSTVPQGVEVVHAPNGTDPGLADRSRAPERPAYACFVGLLAPWQGMDLLLAAAASPRWPAGVGLHVVGEGEHAARVRAAAEGLAHLTFHGRVTRDRALEILAASSLSLCLPSSDLARNQINGIPFKLLESLVLGVPTVVSPLAQQTGTVQLVQGGVTAEETPSGVALAVREVLDRPVAPGDREALSRRAARLLSWEPAVDAAVAAVAPALQSPTGEHDVDRLEHDEQLKPEVG